MAVPHEPSDNDDDCPLCRGDYPSEFAERIIAAAQKSSEVMTLEEVKAWLTTLENGRS